MFSAKDRAIIAARLDGLKGKNVDIRTIGDCWDGTIIDVTDSEVTLKSSNECYANVYIFIEQICLVAEKAVPKRFDNG